MAITDLKQADHAYPFRVRPRWWRGDRVFGYYGSAGSVGFEPVKLTPSDGHLVHFVGTVGDAQGAGGGEHPRQGEGLNDSGATVHLDRPIDYLARHPGGDNLDG